MVAGGLPTVQVLLDDGTGAFPYDITSKARLKYTVSRGRQDEQSQVTPGQLQLVLNNTDGRFTPGSTIIALPSPIVADQRVRVKVTANATTFNRFTGYVQAWPVEWPSGGQELSEVTITAVDGQARGERRPLELMGVEEIREDLPTLLYQLNEPEGATAAGDTSGNAGPTLGFLSRLVPNGVPTFDGSKVTFANGDGLGSNTLRTTITGTWVCAFQTTDIGASFEPFWGGFPAGSDVGARILGVNSNKLVFNAAGLASASDINDDAPHVGHAVMGGGTATLYLDGVSVGSGALASVDWYDLIGGRVTASVWACAFFPTALSAARVAAQAAALINGVAGESGTARLTRLAGYGNLPVGTLDSSLSMVADGDTSGKSLSGAIQETADAEFGLAFVDGSGNLTFHNRNRVVAKTTPDITIDANQLDEGTSFVTDMQGVVNYFEASSTGGARATQVARDTTSETSHGRYPQSQNYLLPSDQEALDRANWIVYTHKEPGPRVGTLAIDMLTLTAAQQAQLLAAEASTWIQVTGLPSQTPGGTTADLIVQGLTDSLSKDAWALTLNVVSQPAIYPTPWILGNATYGALGSTTRLYV